jgi:PKD repeat protein
MNFGWPIFEGMENHGGYTNALTPNMDAPNPLFNGVTCTQQFFNFQDLLVQDTPQHLGLWPNPCDASQQIPINIPKFKHSRPAIDWRHGQDIARAGSFNGNTATVHNLNSAGSPVSGPVFRGNAALGGPVISGNGWPTGYQNVNMSADYVSGWIRRFVFDANEQPASVHDFASGLGNITWLGEGPDGCVWYLRYNSSDLRKICYTAGANLPPVAVASQNTMYGPGPLTVAFTGSTSSDPEGATLSYTWDFGDGNTSNLADPAHIFNAPPGIPTTYSVTLTVTDDQNQTDVTSLIASVNNTPPVVSITSFPDSALYPVGIDTLFNLQASVSDAEHGPSELTYSWRTTLHHNTHVHHEPEDNDVTTNTLISGVGCYEEEYYYKVRLVVTDDDGLSTTVTHTLLPNCAAIGPIAIMQSDGFSGYAPFAVNFSGTQSFDPGGIVSYYWTFGDGTSSTQPEPSHVYTTSGSFTVTLTVTDGDGLQGVTTGTIAVIDLDPPACVGAAGSLLREYWTGISGTSISALTSDTDYPNTPSGSNAITAFQGPQNWGNDYGTRVRGYIIAPEDGQYVFNITGDDDTRFYLSLNADPAYKQLVAQINGWTNPTEFSKYSSQRSAPIQLVANTYYYVELQHKEGGGGDHFAVYWETPSNPSLTLIGSQHLASWVECPPSLALKTMLQGPYDGTTGLMRDDLRANGLLPLLEPFTSSGYAHVGGGGETTTGSLLSLTGPDAIVDWVLVELRDKNDPTIILATRSALVQRDGDVISVDGNQSIPFSLSQGEYHVAVRHRNHLGVMTSNAIAFGNQAATVDLTDGSTALYGTDATYITGTGEHLLWSGNVNPDGLIKYTGANNDRDPMLAIIGTTVTNTVSGYFMEDVNLDSQVKYIGTNNDRDLILINIGGSIPTNTRSEQLP